MLSSAAARTARVAGLVHGSNAGRAWLAQWADVAMPKAFATGKRVHDAAMHKDALR